MPVLSASGPYGYISIVQVFLAEVFFGRMERWIHFHSRRHPGPPATPGRWNSHVFIRRSGWSTTPIAEFISPRATSGASRDRSPARTERSTTSSNALDDVAFY